MAKLSFLGASLLGAALVALPLTALAQGSDVGKSEYLSSCADCHGVSGKGDGPIAAFLTKPPTDLTTIQKGNMGVFPFNRIYEIIDGREAVAVHGPREMPVWGNTYRAEAGAPFYGFATPKDLESLTRGRIIALIGYIYSLQKK